MNQNTNIVEAAAELAHRDLKIMTEHIYLSLNEEEIHAVMWREDPETMGDDNPTFIYTEKAQDLFNNIYDDIFDILLKAKAE